MLFRSQATIASLTMNTGSVLTLGNNLGITTAAIFDGDISFTGTKTLTIGDNATLTAQNDFKFDGHTVDTGVGSQVIMNDASMDSNSASITGSGTVTVSSTKSYTHNDGNILVPITNSGSMTIKNSIGNGNSFVSVAGSTLTFDSTDHAIVSNFGNYTTPIDVDIVCSSNPITIQGAPLDVVGLGVTGTAGCVVTAELTGINDPVSVAGATLSLTGTGNENVTADISLTGTGSIGNSAPTDRKSVV